VGTSSRATGVPEAITIRLVNTTRTLLGVDEFIRLNWIDTAGHDLGVGRRSGTACV